jgi:hypothetical protein
MPLSVQPWWSTRTFALTMILLAAVPLLLPATPPLVDLPAHIGRYAVELAGPASPLHRWYHFEWAVIGNLGIDLLVVPLSKLFGIELAVKLIVLTIPPLTVAGMLLVAREAHGPLPPTAALALPLAYGYPFQFGFANFALSMACALLGFALWLRLGRTGHIGLRAALFVPFGIILWFMHSFGWGVLGLLAFSSDLVRRHRSGKPWIKSAWEAGLAVIPLMPPILLMLVWRSGHVSGGTSDWFNFKFKLFYLMNILRNDGTSFDHTSTAFLMVFSAFGLLGIGLRRNPLLLLSAAILVIAFILLPRIVLGSAYADMRLAPYMLAVMVLAFTPITRNRRIQGLIALAAVSFFVARLGVQTMTYLRLDREFKSQLEALKYVPRGARIFGLTDLQCLGVPYSRRMDHLGSLAIVRREAFTNGQFAMAGAQLLSIDYPAAAGFNEDPSQIIRPDRCKQQKSYSYPAVLEQFPRTAFDYLWLINFVPDRRPQSDPGLIPIWQGPRGALYRIRRTPSGG